MHGHTGGHRTSADPGPLRCFCSRASASQTTGTCSRQPRVSVMHVCWSATVASLAPRALRAVAHTECAGAGQNVPKCLSSGSSCRDVWQACGGPPGMRSGRLLGVSASSSPVASVHDACYVGWQTMPEPDLGSACVLAWQRASCFSIWPGQRVLPRLSPVPRRRCAKRSCRLAVAMPRHWPQGGRLCAHTTHATVLRPQHSSSSWSLHRAGHSAIDRLCVTMT